MIEVVNQQRKIKIDREKWREFAEKATDLLKESRDKIITIAFISDQKMRELNCDFRGKNTTTDVLSFPFEVSQFDEENGNSLGDIAVSVEQAQRQALENNLTLDLEISQLILHGILHLSGYDHETDTGEMNTLELKLRDKLGI